MSRQAWFAIAVVSALAAGPVITAGAQHSESRKPIPRPAVEAIVNAFNDHRLVAIGEMHRNEHVHADSIAVARSALLANATELRRLSAMFLDGTTNNTIAIVTSSRDSHS